MSQVRGLPLLSGPPPDMGSGDACRKCNKEFNMFLNRSRKCNHCGYLYCSNCSDYQAMMPRSGQESGYEPKPVCAYCIDFLNITAAGKSMLKDLHSSKLKKYLEAYDIDIGRVFEKDDLIDAILKARNSNGCLSPEKEDYYRNYSVPDRSTSHTRYRLFGRSAGQSSNRPVAPSPSVPSTRPYNFPRPDLEPNPSPQQPRTPRSGPPPPPRQTHPSQRSPPSVPPRPQHQSAYPPHHHQQPHNQYQQYSHHQPPHPTPPHASRPTGQNQRPSAARSTENLRQPGVEQPRQRTASAASPVTSPPPTLDQLLEMPDDSIKALSIGALKSILFTNHVNVRQILEKGDLIMKVKALIEDERRDRERQRVLHEAEEQEAIERQRAMLEEHARAQAERAERERAEQQRQEGASPVFGEAQGQGTAQNAGTERSPEPSSAPVPPPKSPPKARGTAADLERTGLCVICQDEEANIAIVDCGHLALCRGCSELIMASSRECPLCRTRIVTESRLLRIFKT